MKYTSITFILLLCLSACTTTPAPKPSDVKHPKDTHITITKLVFTQKSQVAFTLAASGKITLGPVFKQQEGKHVATLHKDGSMTLTDKDVKLQLKTDGLIHMTSPKEQGDTSILITPEGSILDAVTKANITLSKDGSVLLSGSQTPAFKVENLTPETRRTAGFVLSIFLIPLGTQNKPATPVTNPTSP